MFPIRNKRILSQIQRTNLLFIDVRATICNHASFLITLFRHINECIKLQIFINFYKFVKKIPLYIHTRLKRCARED